ncbi:MAG: fumarate hydratase C-terminal domain-containing protein, partial [bacterium]
MPKSKIIKLIPPVDEKIIAGLKAGDKVLITGPIIAARDSAHQLFEHRPPFEPKGAILFYASATPAANGKAIGSVGPTTATRMDPYTPALLKLGVKVTIGKGERGEEVIAAMKKYKAVYLIVPGGVAAANAKYVK